MDTASDVITTMFHAVDDLDWDTVRRCCAPVLATDYTSLWGGEPGRVSIDALVTDWGGMAPGFDATQHLLGPFAVIDASATSLTVGTNVRAYHHIAGVRRRRLVYKASSTTTAARNLRSTPTRPPPSSASSSSIGRPWRGSALEWTPPACERQSARRR